MVQSKCQSLAITNSQNLNIIFWNAGGLTTNKIIEYEQLLNIHNPDVFAVIDAGSFAEKQDKLNEYFKGYQLNLKKRDRKISSGMIVGVKRELSCSFKIIKEMSNSDRLEAVSLNVWKSKKKFPCVIIYNPPNNIGCFDVLPIEENCIFFGDFNSPSQRWGYNSTTNAGKNKENFIDTSTLEIIRSTIDDDYTFLSPIGSKTNPDLVLSNIKTQYEVHQNSIGIIGSHGHKIIKINIFDQIMKQLKETKSIPAWNFKKVNWEDYCDLSRKIFDESMITKNSDISEKKIRNAFLYCARRTIPKGKVANYKPFWNDKLTELSKARDDAFLKLDSQWSTVNKNHLMKCQNELDEELLSAKEKKFLNELESLDYRFASANTHKKISTMNENIFERSNSVLVKGDKIISDNKKKAQAFVKHFSKVSSGSTKMIAIRNDDETEPFSLEDLQEAVSSMDNNKAPGPEGIFVEFIKHLNINAAVIMLTFFNYILINGIPAIWRKATIVPILKPTKNPEDVASYRPIALTSILCKIYEKLIMKKLNKHLRKEKILDKAQGAF